MENSFLQMIGSGVIIYLVLIPGMISVWLRKGTSSSNPFIFIVESFVHGILAVIIAFGFALLLNFSQKDFLPIDEVISGIIILTWKGFEELVRHGNFSAIGIFFWLIYLAAFSYGLIARANVDWSYLCHPFRTRHQSALDLEFLRLRKYKIQPAVIIKTTSGEVLEGLCRIYSFSEPRELLLEVPISGQENTFRLIWCKVDDKVASIEVIDERKEIGKILVNRVKEHFTKKLSC